MISFKRLALLFFLVFILSRIFRGAIYRTFVTYKPVGDRINYEIENPRLKILLDNQSGVEALENIDQVIESALKITSDHLRFTPSKNKNNPNSLIETRTAHCVGYASFFASICNYLIRKNGLNKYWYPQP